MKLETALTSMAILMVTLLLAAMCAFAVGKAHGARLSAVQLRSACDVDDRRGLRPAYYRLGTRDDQ